MAPRDGLGTRWRRKGLDVMRSFRLACGICVGNMATGFGMGWDARELCSLRAKAGYPEGNGLFRICSGTPAIQKGFGTVLVRFWNGSGTVLALHERG